MGSFLVISTGGTIESRPGAGGLAPSIPREEILTFVSGRERFGKITVLDLLSKDSSNMSPEDWQAIARRLRAEEENHDGFLILHGTDTMAYTASALSFLLPGFKKPVVLTGSMLPPGVPGSDGGKNMKEAFLFLSALVLRMQRGVSIAFHGWLIHGPRSQKILSSEGMAFSSINYPHLGRIRAGKPILGPVPRMKERFPVDVSSLAVEQSIFLVTLFPGFPSRHLEHIVDASPKAVVLEALGLGGVPFLGENLLPSISRCRERNIPVVITTQRVYGGVDLTVYEVGRKTLELGAISGKDMTREAIITKLMAVLPALGGEDLLPSVLHSSFCDEIEAGIRDL